mgnify:FL=1
MLQPGNGTAEPPLRCPLVLVHVSKRSSGLTGWQSALFTDHDAYSIAQIKTQRAHDIMLDKGLFISGSVCPFPVDRNLSSSENSYQPHLTDINVTSALWKLYSTGYWGIVAVEAREPLRMGQAARRKTELTLFLLSFP